MGLFNKPKKNNTTSDDVRGEVATNLNDNTPDPAAEKAHQKKIKNMKKKFADTVFASALEIMKDQIPQFVIVEPDPEYPEVQITRYVLLGFDTRIVDDFSNKSDDDVGSIMTAIKSSMDCIIESGLLDNELILMIPTSRTLTALAEFEETFNLRFYIAYVSEDHAIALETKSAEQDEYIVITLPEIRTMLEENVYIKDKIIALQEGRTSTGDIDDISSAKDETSDEETESDNNNNDNDDDAIPEDELEVPPEEQDESENPTVENVKQAVSEATDSAHAQNVSDRIVDQKADIKSSTSAASAAPVVQPTASGGDPVESAADKLNRLKSTVQSASDSALKDQAIRHASANINPQARMKTFDMQAMDQYITRKYYSDELGLEVSSEPFDAMFMQSNQYVPFEEIESDNWLSGYVNNLRRDANTRLARLHHENLMIMRERYMLIITKHCENIVKSVATDDPKSRFGYALKTITQIKNDNMAKLHETAETYKREKEEEFQGRMQAEMTNAANIAKTNFMNLYGKDHERELKEIETELKNNIESEFVAAKENLKVERRKEAKRQLDIGISEAIRICADEYAKMQALERKEYTRLQGVITEFENENMSADEARINALSEEQRRVNEVVKVREEYDAKYDLANREFEAKLAAVKAEIDKSNAEHDNYVDELREQHDRIMQDLRNSHNDQLAHKAREIDILNEQIMSKNTQIETLTKKYAELDDKVGKKYRNQIDMLKSEREAWTERADQIEHLHKYTDKLKLTGMIIGIVAAMGIGVIIGCAVTAKNAEEQANKPVVHYYEDSAQVTTVNNAFEPAETTVVEAEKADEKKPAETTVKADEEKPAETTVKTDKKKPAETTAVTTKKPATTTTKSAD